MFTNSVKMVFSIVVVEHWDSLVWYRFGLYWAPLLFKKHSKILHSITERKTTRHWVCALSVQHSTTEQISVSVIYIEKEQSGEYNLDHYGLVLSDRAFLNHMALQKYTPTLQPICTNVWFDSDWYKTTTKI